MKFFKKRFLLLILLTNISFAQEDTAEYKVELIIFKYIDFKTNETFKTKLKIPDKNIVYLFDETSLFDRTEHSNFSNMSEFYIDLFSNIDSLDIKKSPKPLYRDNDNLTVLNKLKNKIENDKDYILLDSKSWIQTIPDIEFSDFLSYQSQNNYGFFIKLYKKRFMHIDLKAYLGNLNTKSSNITIFIDNEKRIFNDEIHFFDHPYFGVVVSVNEI
mgnify:CR=1 FL=1